MTKKAKKTVKKAPLRVVEKKTETRSEGVKKTKIMVVGVGGGGGAIVSEIASRMQKASFTVANTDLQALRATSRKTVRFPFGQNFTRGLGTGMDAELGREAALADKERIKKLLEDQDFCIIVACLGGGTGSGAAPVFAKISKSLGNITYGIFTLPFKFEGERKMEIAKESLKRVRTHLNAMTFIPNERIFQIIDKATPLKGAFSAINRKLTESLEGLIETIYEPGLINIDFADFKTILQGRGRLAFLNTVEMQRKGSSAKDLIVKVLNSPLSPYGIRGAKGVLFNIAGEKKLSLSEVSQISKTISELANPEAKIIFGISQSKKYSDVIKTTLLASGCGAKIFPPVKIKKKVSKRRGEKKVVRKKKTSVVKKKRRRKKIKKVVRKRRKKISQKTKPEKKPLKKKRMFNLFKRKKKRRKKAKIKVVEKTKKKLPEKIKIKVLKELPSPFTKKVEKANAGGEKIRKNAVQIKKEAEEEEKEILEKEKFWEAPAFLRKKLNKGS
jgi:cell division protein FtsZ